ncbi:MAG: endonuclease/exonuclease/phosphatase family protein [Spirochaetales bacterium]|nr:endonuclease/exonuclease/phosphatase family protein [Spirochaetales bacterium]
MKRILLIISTLLISVTLYAQDLTIVTLNAWPGISGKGFLSCQEFENEEVRMFRHEVLAAGLKKLDADIIVLNGINPAPAFAETAAGELGMTSDVWISKSGFRIGPVSLPLNLKVGDAILAKDSLAQEPFGRKLLNGGISNRTFTLFSRNGSQIICSKITQAGTDIYVFSVEWAESVFSDRESLQRLLDAYINEDIEPGVYSESIRDAVGGAQLRKKQAEETLSFINNTAGGAPVILCGSLNALPDSDEMNILKSAGFIDVWEKDGRGKGYTWAPYVNTNIDKMNDPRPKAGYRSDYILIRGNELIPVAVEIVFDEPVYGVFPSNRFGLRAVVRLSESPSE